MHNHRVSAAATTCLRMAAIVACFGLSLPATVSLAGPDGRETRNAVYTLTNSIRENAVVIFNRATDGSLIPAGRIGTGGTGTGGGLGNQGALILSEDGRSLFAVNPGSNSISAFKIGPRSLRRTDIVWCRGTRPISLTMHGSLLYVLNGGGVNNITGFTVDANCRLIHLPESTRPLSANSTGPAQVSFSPSGDLLVVTEKGTNIMDTYIVGADGRASGPIPNASSGMTPFGFSFDIRGDMIVSEAFGGAPGLGALSSYHPMADGSLPINTASAPDHQAAPCWVVITSDCRYTYTTNTADGTISGYGIGEDGSLSLLDEDGVTAITGPGSVPIDCSLSADSRFLYVLNGGFGTIQGFRVEDDGSLTPIGSVGFLPMGANGLAAR